jgi:hypothetical protein
MEIKKTPKTPKNAKIFNCEKCDFICSKQSDFDRHCATRKHKMEIMEINGNDELSEQQTSSYSCANCGKNYATKAGLWKHAKLCKLTTTPNESTHITVSHDDIPSNEPIKNYIMKLVEQNNELKNMFIQQNTELQEIREQNNHMQTLISEQPKQITNIQNNKTITNNIQNNQFNLTVFLQERCKDALNMSQFIDTLQINPQSVEYTGAHGYVNGITKIFMDGLNQLDIHERPIHCTDLKRETLYIKENDKWEKDTEEKTKFKHALATVVNRNVAQVSHWEKENPRSQIPETEEYEFYFDIVRQSLGGGNHDVTARNNDKILRAIAGKVYLDKKTKELQ